MSTPLHKRLPIIAAVVAAVVLTLGAGTGAAQAHPTGHGSHGGQHRVPTHLSVEHLSSPMDVDSLSAPQLGWQVGAGMQSAYQVQVATTPRALEHRPDVWDSGTVPSTHDGDIPFGGRALTASSGYYWRVRTWDTAAHPSGWSKPAQFGTGPGSTWPDATPIWAGATSGWTNYTFTGTFDIQSNIASVTFRESNTSNFYLWQFKATDNTIAPQIQVNGHFSNLKDAEPLPFTLQPGTDYRFKIVADGSTFTTYLQQPGDTDWTLVDTTTDSTFSSGGIGFRTGRTEQVYFDDIAVTADPNGTTLYANDFSDASNTDFGCGTITSGTLFVGTSQNCGTGLTSTDWAFLRGDVTLAQHKRVQWAHLYATGASTSPTRQFVYKLWLNGHYVGVGPVRPVDGETRYDGYDVTALITSGTNTVAAQAYTTQDQRFLADLVVRYTDGSTRTFGTGPDWSARDGSDILPAAGSIGTGYYTAPKEDYRAANYPFGFTQPGFDASSWPAAATKADFTDLQPTPTAKIEQRLETPVKVDEYQPGDYFIDYGRTWIGGMSLNLDGSAGQSVDIRYGQIPSGTDSVKYRTNAGNDYEDSWTLRAGQQHLESWGLRVFRYVQILGAPTGLSAADLTAEAYVYPFDESDAVFDSSSSNLNQVWTLSRNTIEAANENMYVDSWERERGLYEADSYLQLMSNLYLDGDSALGNFSMDFLMSNRTWPTEWPMYMIQSMHELYQATGDLSTLRDDYAALQGKLPDKWFDPSSGLIHKTTGDTGANSHTDDDIVDWPASERDGYVFSSYNTVINAISYRSYVDMADIATALGKSADAAGYTAKAEAIKAAVNARMWDADKGAYRDGLNNDGTPIQHWAIQASVFATAFGLANSDQAAQTAQYIGSRGMACSVYCAAFLLEALYDGNAGGTALDLLTSTGIKSWMNMINLGAGATMEAWDPSLKPNLTFSHPWAASPAFDVPQGLFGIRPTTPGYYTFDVKPRPGGLDWAHITVPTQNGEIGAAFAAHDGATDVGVSVPANSTANVYVPSSSSDTSVWLDGRRATATRSGGYLEVEGVSPGCHVLTTSPHGATAQLRRGLAAICAPGQHGG